MSIIDDIREAKAEATPGPWFMHDFSLLDEATACARDVSVSCTHPDHITVAVMWGGFYGVHAVDKARLDARLIALAPQMAEICEAAEKQNSALQSAEESIVAFIGQTRLGRDSGAQDILSEVRAALAAYRKATE